MRRLLLALAVVPLPVLAQSPLDGFYTCGIGSAVLGEMVLKDGKFRGPAHDRAFEGPARRYRVDGPTILWDDPVGGISGVGTIVSTVVKGDADGAIDGFDLTIQNAGSGNFQTVSCAGPA